ncbi:MAG: hypothetical protein C5B59_19015 [Bacteroidetes bacterium]|nr:MAG: hypothetical protein C5B59_19015 [Bacteroidota bacterium]
MQQTLVYVHSILRWLILIFLILSITRSFSGWRTKRIFMSNDRRTWLFTLIFSHITLLLGLYQVFFGRYGIFTTTLPAGTHLMKNKFFRFFWIEHPIAMILAIVFVTLGYGMSKKPVSDETKFRKAFIYFVIALLFIITAIPWPFREIVGRPLFPGT